MKVASVCAILFGVIGLNDGTSAQIPEGYEVVVLANDLGIHSRPEINNRSEVVWSSAFPPDVADVWLYSDGVIRKIRDDGGYDVHPSINNNSVVTWIRCESYFNSGCDLIIWEGGEMTTVETPHLVHQSPKINDANQIVWVHDFSGTFDDVEVFLTEQGETLQITDDDLSNQGPRGNSAGDIAWVQFDFSVGPWVSQIMLHHEGTTTQLTEGDVRRSPVDINDHVQVIWYEEGAGVVLWDAGILTVISSDGSNPCINNDGDVLFAKWNDQTQQRETWGRLDGVFFALPDFGYSNASGSINDQREVAWRGLDTVTGDTAILVMRRLASMGDFDGDSHVDMRDARAMQLCVAKSNAQPGGGLLGDCGPRGVAGGQEARESGGLGG